MKVIKKKTTYLPFKTFATGGNGFQKIILKMSVNGKRMDRKNAFFNRFFSQLLISPTNAWTSTIRDIPVFKKGNNPKLFDCYSETIFTFFGIGNTVFKNCFL